MSRSLILLSALILGLSGPANAYHQGETFKVSLKTASVHGSYDKRACSVQVNLRSVKRQRVSFAIYWKPGRGLWLLTTHQAFKNAKGGQNIEFLFSSGAGMRFPMKHKGAQVQANIGFGSNASKLYDNIGTSQSMTINLPGVQDQVRVNLQEKGHVLAAMSKCRDFLH